MQFGAALAPIAAATIVNAILAGLAWRGSLAERRTGRLPWQLEAGAVGYALAMIALAYGLNDTKIGTPLSLFGVAIAGEALGLLIVYGIGRAYQMRSEPWRKRGLTVFFALGLTLVVFASVFTS